MLLSLTAGALVSPTFRSHGGYVVAVVALVVAAGMVRFARCGVRVSAKRVRVTNMFRTVDLPWEQIREFKLSPVGASLVGLKSGRWVQLTGIEQTNIAFLRKEQDTPERSMIAELNELLREHTAGT